MEFNRFFFLNNYTVSLLVACEFALLCHSYFITIPTTLIFTSYQIFILICNCLLHFFFFFFHVKSKVTSISYPCKMLLLEVKLNCIKSADRWNVFEYCFKWCYFRFLKILSWPAFFLSDFIMSRLLTTRFDPALVLLTELVCCYFITHCYLALNKKLQRKKSIKNDNGMAPSVRLASSGNDPNCPHRKASTFSC